MSRDRDTILQFGTGRFLRAFVDLFVQEVNEAGAIWDVVCVQSTGAERAAQLNAGPFHVAIRGMSAGAMIDETRSISSVSRGLAADRDWETVRSLAQRDCLKIVVSNTTEAGLSLDPADTERSGVPRSFPAKLLDLLLQRMETDAQPLTILPCELVDGNADVLRALVLEQACKWGVDASTRARLEEENVWCNTLVDRIVSAPTEDHPLRNSDPLLAVAEPFAFWAIVAPGKKPIDHPSIQVVDSVTPYALRKVRLLNGAHTALVERALGRFATVREAMADPSTREWLHTLVFEELVPCIDARVEDADGFAKSVFERFDNPFLDHRLEDIALHQSDKVGVRLLPPYHEYLSTFDRVPKLLGDTVEPYLRS